MRIKVSIILAFFITFLSMPTVVSLIKNEINVSNYYTDNEEEEEEFSQKEYKECKASLKSDNLFFNNFYIFENKKDFVSIIKKNAASVSLDILIPPPKFC